MCLWVGNGTRVCLFSVCLYKSSKDTDHKLTNLLILFTLCLEKNCANLFLSELRQILTNFDNFWQKDGKEAKIIWGSFIFHIT